MSGMNCVKMGTAVAVMLCIAGLSAAQTVTPPQSSPLRPMVLIQVPEQETEDGLLINATEAGRVAVGIFDTGDPFNTFSEETRVQINPGYSNGPANGGTNTQIGVTKYWDWNASGFLGATLAGPQDTINRTAANQPTHIFGTANDMNQTDQLLNGRYRDPVWYYNNKFSENHIGTAFVSNPIVAAGVGPTRLVAGIDPINARTMPFPYDSRPSDIAGLSASAPSLPLDQQTTSVSFFVNDDPHVPQFPLADNPGNTFRIPFVPLDLANANTTNFNVTEFAVGSGNAAAFFDRGESIGPRPFLQSVDVRTTVNGAIINNTANYLMDTGAPSTNVPSVIFNALPGGTVRILPELRIPVAGGGSLVLTNVPVTDSGSNTRGLIGANIYNMFGQFWDFERNELVLTGAAKPDVLFAVNGDTLGLSRTGVNQDSRFTGGADPAGRSVFRTSQTGSNADFVDKTALPLVAGDQIKALSLGQDAVGPILFYSVSTLAAGQAGTAVAGQAGRNQVGGDVFVSGTEDTSRTVGTNQLYINQELMGLGVGGNATTRTYEGPNGSVAGVQDELNDFELDRPRVIDPLAAGTIDGTITSPTALAADTFHTYLTLAPGSPTLALVPGGADAADILINSSAGLLRWADGQSDIGLLSGDVIDALVLDDTFGSGALNFGIDKALFSLAFNSTTLNLLDLSPADIFITHFNGSFSLFATAESLGLQFSDEIDGLDSIPEPATLALLGLAMMLMSRRRGREA